MDEIGKLENKNMGRLIKQYDVEKSTKHKGLIIKKNI